MEESLEALDEKISDEVDVLSTTMDDAELARLLEERGHGLPPGTPGRAAWLGHAGERWQTSGDLARARACLQEAVQDGGWTYVDPRAELVDVLLDLGETGQADDLLAELRRELAAGRVGGPVPAYVGESLEMHDRLEAALRWFNEGLISSGHRDDGDLACLNGRFRVRRRLGLPHDHDDDLCEQRRHEHAIDFAVAEEHPLPGGPDPPSARLTVLYWPPDEFAPAVDRWPDLAQYYGSEHVEHRATVERRLRELRGKGIDVTVGTCDLADYLRFTEGRDEDPTASSTRAGYAAHLGYLGRTTAWPPTRNAPCWCGSGSTYEQCCGGIRFPPSSSGHRIDV